MSCPPPSPPHVAPRLVAALWPTLLLLVLLMFVQLDPIGTIQSSGVLVCRTEVIANTELDFKKTLKEDIKFQSLGLLVRTPAKAPCDDTDKTTKTCEDIIQRNANYKYLLDPKKGLDSVIFLSKVGTTWKQWLCAALKPFNGTIDIRLVSECSKNEDSLVTATVAMPGGNFELRCP